MNRIIVLAPLFIVFLLAQSVLANVPRNAKSPFGVICPWEGIEDAGIKWVRCGAGCSALDWGAINKAPGIFEWVHADNEVKNSCDKYKVDLLVILGYTPKWASSGPNGEPAYPPKTLSDWSEFVRRIVYRYRNRIKYWEVWNEPDIGFWQGDIREYADLLKSAYVAAKKADPDCKIVFGGTAGVNIPFLERVYEHGIANYFDIMAVHPYQWGDTFNDEWFVAQLRDLHQLMHKWGDGHKEIWLTELGWSTGDATITEEIQARLLAQAMITAHTLTNANVTKYFWFCVKDWGGPGYGLIRPDGSRKPAFDAYRMIINVLENAEYIRTIPHENLRCHLFGKQGKELLAIWSPDKKVYEFKLPLEKDWEQIMYLDGRIERYDSNNVAINVGPEPIFVFGKGKEEATKRNYIRQPSYSIQKDVWYSVQVPKGTSRLWIDKNENRAPNLKVLVHNDSNRPCNVVLRAKIGAYSSIAKSNKPIQPGGVQLLPFRITLPSTCKEGLETLEINGTANGKPISTTKMSVRVSSGPVIEFLANSTVERGYIVEDNGSGCSPSVRFNGTWTYKFSLENCKSAMLDLCVGAHEANEWQVLVSDDQKNWKTALSGKSNRSWHSINLLPYVGREVFVKFTGNNQQLSELVLTMGR